MDDGKSLAGLGKKEPKPDSGEGLDMDDGDVPVMLPEPVQAAAAAPHPYLALIWLPMTVPQLTQDCNRRLDLTQTSQSFCATAYTVPRTASGPSNPEPQP